mmetsp:Transcript_85548/g.242544  ORF Transcript_85548/g.242544 Transcript_85548/m.242544 type:complete len:247 (+) Transcript_85548:43-783(+)
MRPSPRSAVSATTLEASLQFDRSSTSRLAHRASLETSSRRLQPERLRTSRFLHRCRPATFLSHTQPRRSALWRPWQPPRPEASRRQGQSEASSTRRLADAASPSRSWTPACARRSVSSLSHRPSAEMSLSHWHRMRLRVRRPLQPAREETSVRRGQLSRSRVWSWQHPCRPEMSTSCRQSDRQMASSRRQAPRGDTSFSRWHAGSRTSCRLWQAASGARLASCLQFASTSTARSQPESMEPTASAS